MEFYISPQSGQFYMINVLENQWLSVTFNLLSKADMPWTPWNDGSCKFSHVFNWWDRFSNENLKYLFIL